MTDPRDTSPEELVRAASLDRLRGHRNRPDRAQGLGGAIAIGKGIEKRARAVGAVAGAWEVCVPDELRGQSELLSFTGGVVKVGVRSGAARYKLDRWLRGGGRRCCAARPRRR